MISQNEDAELGIALVTAKQVANISQKKKTAKNSPKYSRPRNADDDWVYPPGCVRTFKIVLACADILGAMFIFSVLMAVVYSAFDFVYLIITEKTDEWMVAPAILASLCFVTLFILITMLFLVCLGKVRDSIRDLF